jgi:tol-pal system protein YbgF
MTFAMRVTACALLASVVLVWASAADAQRSPNVSQRVTWLEDRVEELENRQEGAGTDQLVDVLQRLDMLEREMRELRGEIERMTHEMESLTRRQRELYLDLDRRLQNLETGGRPERPVPSLGAMEPLQEQADGGSPVGDPAAERAEYDAAFRMLQEGRYPAAISAFQAYLERYPDGRFADNAQYWLGEAHYVSRDYRAALVLFQEVEQRFPSSQKVADAKLKIGYVHYELQQWEDARAVLTDVTQRYPGTTIARLADQRLQRMRQEGR